MRPTDRLLRPLAWLALPACALCAAVGARAQTAPVSPTPAELAKYDVNRNGRLDPEELATMRAANASASATGDITQLSPFTVATTRDTGYFAENTLAGSRLNTNLGDLAASITVVTKQQMEDTASLDINDVFKYEASTEGSGSYSPSVVDRGTVKDTNAGYSFGNNGDTTTNAQSNRIRGLNSPDAAINNYSTNNRIPFDGYNIQSLEISRGPNSLLFGLGTPAGVVNTNYARATLNKEDGQAQVRFDNNGSYRGSLSLNRTLIKDQLAAYGAFVYDNRQFERKPSRDLYRRQYGALTYRPFSKTVIRGFAENYQNDANRPNSFTPRDWVAPWLAAGRPAYDPVARTVTVLDTNRVLGPYVTNVNSPGYNAAVNTILGANAFGTVANNPLFVAGLTSDDVARPLRRIDNGAVVDFFARQPQFYAPAQTNPATATPTAASLGWTAGDSRFLIADRMWTASAALPIPTTTVNGRTFTYGSYQNAGVTNKSLYDWTEYNTLQTNFGKVKARNYNLEIEQQLLPNLFFTAGWLRQDIDDVSNYTINQLQGATLAIDTNVNLPNGQRNPYFGLPFIFEGAGGGLDTFFAPETDDNYRAMLAYDLNLQNRGGWMKWLGRHRILGLWQEQDVMRAVERWRMNFVAGDADGTLRYVANAAAPGVATWSNTATMRHYYMASPGDPQARVTHSIGFYGNQGWQSPYTSMVNVWNYNNGQFQNDQLQESLVFSSAGSFKTQREVKGTQLALQSYLWEDRLVTTFGWRKDKYRARITTAGAIVDESGKTVEVALPNSRLFSNGSNGLVDRNLVMNRWNRWDRLEGATKTLGGAFRPLRGLGFIRRTFGENSLASEFLQGLSFYYNKSDNFNPPATFQTDYNLRPLPKPTGKGRDIGVGFNLFNNKLVARLNWYETENLNERTSAANTLLTRSAYSDTTTGIPWASTVVRIRNGLAAGRTLDQIISVNNWNSDTVNNVSDAANQQKIWDLLKLPVNYYTGISPGATQDSKAKGVELQLTYNITNNWRVKVTGSKDRATYRNVAPQYDDWISQRLPVWQSMTATEIPDFTDPNSGRRYSLRNFWTGYGFVNVAQIENTDGNTSPQAYYNNVVVSQVALAKALEGAISPMQRQYRASGLMSYDIREGRFKGVGLGGSLRWESKAAIGFYGKVGDPINSPTVINLNDVTRPVYDDGNYYSDIWISYSRRIFRDRIGWKLQLNVNNWTESGRLMPTQVNFDGTPWAFRIIDPRQFIVTSTFSF